MSVSIVASELRGLYDQHRALTPQIVVDAARPEGSPLHARFEWDDQVAGEAYRHVQAAHLIRSVKVTIQRPDGVQEPTRIRAFLHLPVVEGEAEDGDEEPAVSTYVPEDVVRASPELSALALREMKRRLVELQRTYGEYEEFWTHLRQIVA